MVDKFTKPPYGDKLVEKINDIIDDKQDTLVSGTNIKTINNTSLLGSGNIDIQGGGTVTVDDALSTTSTNPVQNKVITTELNKKIEGISSSDVTTALGYTPYNSSNPSGYQANKIETIKVNGTAQTITSKAVDITVPTNNNQLTNGAGYITSSALTPYALSEDLATVATSGSYNDLSNKPTIPAAQVNADWNATSGKAQILNKPTIPTVPTNVSAFTNDAGYLTEHQSLSGYVPTSRTVNGKALTSNITLSASDVSALPSSTVIPTISDTYSATSSNGMSGKAVASAISGKANSATSLSGYGITDAYTKTEIDGKLASGMHYKGTKTSYSNLPTTGNATGDLWNVSDTGANYAWNGTGWDKLSETIDLSGYVPTSRTINGKALSGNISLTASDVGAITGISSSDVTTALGYTPYNATNPNGYTSNVGTITGIKMNGSSKGTSGVVDLGTVITAHQDISGKQDKITSTNKLSADLLSEGTTNKLVSATEKSTWNNKLDSSAISDMATKTWVGQQGYTTNVGTVTKVNNTSPDSNGNVALSIPTVNNATLTITQGGTTKGTFTANASSNVTIDLDAGGGSSRNIGEIVSSTIPLTDAGLHLLDGALIQGSGIYSAFVTYIAGLVSAYPDLFTTESDWQSTVTQYGVCGKFVYNSTNNTVRLPKYSDKIYTQELNTTAPVIGNGMTLGMVGAKSNGTLVNFGFKPATMYNTGDSGVPFIKTEAYGTPVGSSLTGSTNALNNRTIGVTTDPSKSGILADLSGITTSLDGYYYIVIATSTKTDIQVDIDVIASNLNGKADRDLTNTNPSSSFATLLNTAGIRTVVETYVNGTSWYRVYSDGWCEQGGFINTTGFITFLKPFLNNNFIFTATRHYNSKTSAKTSSTTTANQNTVANSTQYGSTDGTGVYLETSSENGCNGKCWRACGYIS